MASWKDSIKKVDSSTTTPSWRETVKPVQESPPQSGFEALADSMRVEAQAGPDLQAAGLGAAQGATFNLSDELEAAARSGLQGQDYDNLVKEIRQRYSQSQTESPFSYGAGNLAGAVGTGMGMSKLLGMIPKVGQALSGAEILQKASTPTRLAANTALTTAQAVPLIAAAKYGASEKQGSEALSEAMPTGLEAAMAPATYLGLKGLGQLPAAKDALVGKAEKILGPYYDKAKKFASEGIELKGKDVQNVLAKNAEESSKQLRQGLEGTFEDAAVVSKNLQEQQAEELKTLKKNYDELTDRAKKQEALDKQIQLEQNASNLKELEKRRASLGESTEQFLDQTRAKISKAYDNVDEALSKTNFQYNTENSPLSGFISAVRSDPNLTEAEVAGIMKQIEAFENRPLDIKSFRELKTRLSNLGGYEKSRQLGGLAKKTYSQINQDLANQLDNAGLNDISNSLKQVNDQYGAFRQYDDTFTGKGYDAKDLTDMPTLRMLKQFGGDTAEELQKTKDVTGLFQRANPEQGPAQLQQMNQFSQDLRSAKNFEPAIPQVNQEVQKLQDLIEQVKGRNTQVPVSSEQQVAEDVYGAVNPSANLTKTKQMNPESEALALQNVDRGTSESLLKNYTNNPEADIQGLKSQFDKTKLSPELLENAETSAEKLDVSRILNKGLFQPSKEAPLFPTANPLVAAQQGLKLIERTAGGRESIAANIGRFSANASKDPQSLYSYYSKVSEPLGNALRAISKEPNAQKRAALTFSMLQKPENRQELQDAGAFNEQNDSGR